MVYKKVPWNGSIAVFPISIMSSANLHTICSFLNFWFARGYQGEERKQPYHQRT